MRAAHQQKKKKTLLFAQQESKLIIASLYDDGEVMSILYAYSHVCAVYTFIIYKVS